MAQQTAEQRTAKSQRAADTKKRKIEELRQLSELQAALYNRKAQGAPVSAMDEPALLWAGVGKARLTELSVAEANRTLEIPDYQRGINGPLVNEMARALRNGGRSGGPIHLSDRQFEDHGTVKGRLYIMDGLQRAFAHLEANVPIQALVYRIKSYEQERQGFVVLNRRVAVSSALIAWNMAGPSMEALRRAAMDEGHPCGGRVGPQARYGFANLNASILMRGLGAALGLKPTRVLGRAPQKLVPEMDEVFKEQVAEAFLRNCAAITPTGEDDRLPLLTSVGLGVVMGARRADGKGLLIPAMPAAALRRVSWDGVTDGKFASRYLPLVVNAITKRWQE